MTKHQGRNRNLARGDLLIRSGLWATSFVFLSSCSHPASPITSAPSVKSDLNTPSVPAIAAPTHEHALRNVHKLGRLISGAVPVGDAAFDELKFMGVKTIISVDGATPDVARAEARGMRYVHIPVTYAEVNEEQQARLARAVRDLGEAGPIFMHCHHGKHRGPAAAASALVALGEVTPDEGVGFMKTAGTAPGYTGLYWCVSTSAPLPKLIIDRASSEFPSIHRASGMVAAMVEVDLAYEHLGHISAAGWNVPADHPDLVPAAEAGRLTDNFRLSGQDSTAALLGTDYLQRLEKAIAGASALEEGIIRGDVAAELDRKFKVVQASCKDCHVIYRDKAN